MMKTIVLGLALILVGCAHLVIYDDDPVPAIAGKVASRVLLCPLTLCLSEVEIGDEKRRIQGQYIMTGGSHQPVVLTTSWMRPPKVVVWGRNEGVVARVSGYLTEDGSMVIERSRLQHILEEQRLRLTMGSDDEILRVGRLAGAEAIVFVEANVKTVTVRSVNVEDGTVRWVGSATAGWGIDGADSALFLLVDWAISRALCPLEQGAQWIEPRPFLHQAGCHDKDGLTRRLTYVKP
ncbi:MAG: hypothetical protein ACKOCD_11535 [Nitrospiraceae bacterium]